MCMIQDRALGRVVVDAATLGRDPRAQMHCRNALLSLSFGPHACDRVPRLRSAPIPSPRSVAARIGPG